VVKIKTNIKFKMAIVSRKLIFIAFLVISLLLFFGSCRRDDPDYIAQRDREKILEYLEEHELEYEELESGVFVVIETEGTGGYPSENSTVKLDYTGTLLNGDIFDSGEGQTIYLPGAVEGFSIGIRQFNRGGEGKFLIPSALGYGSYAQGSIPRNSVLIFDVKLIDFN
jgi:FKBP-type peptidyl-prolyl cis-trans isomerase FkpA